MEPGIYDKKGNLIKSFDSLVEEGFDVEKFRNEHKIESEPFSVHNLFEKYKPIKLVLPDDLLSIGKNVFSYCDTLEEVILGENVKEINSSAFLNCVNLKKIIFNDKLEKLFNGAFTGCKNLEDFKLPASLISLQDEVFRGCDKIKEFFIPSSVKFIGKKVFHKCSNLEKIEVSPENTAFCSINGVLFSKDKKYLLAYPVHKTDKVYNMPKETIEIMEGAFAFNRFIKEVFLPERLESIDTNSFMGTNLTKIYIPPFVSFLAHDAFCKCENLERIDTDSKNKTYYSIDGILFKDDKKTLFLYPLNKTDISYEVPKGVIAIFEGAFAYNKYIKEVIFPEKLEFIGREAFLGTSLEKVSLPNSFKTLLYHAFANCHHLKQVRLPDDIVLDHDTFEHSDNLKEINVSKVFVENHPEFMEKFKDKIIVDKTLEDLLDEGTSFKEINKRFKNNNIER